MNELDLLEELLSITEGYIDQFAGPETREQWQRISATVADMRDGEDI